MFVSSVLDTTAIDEKQVQSFFSKLTLEKLLYAAVLLVLCAVLIKLILKAADKLSAHIKCLEELKAGNLEFRRAAEQTEQALDDFHLPELTYFREHFLPSFRLTLDEME